MAQAESVAIPKRLPLVLGPENRGESTSYDAKLVNGFLERLEGDEYAIYQRPGMSEDSRPPAGNATGRGVVLWRGSVYSIFNGTLYKDGVAVAGSVNNGGGVYRFDACLGGTPRLLMGNGVAAYTYDTVNGLVQITDVDFPASFVKGWSYINATNYVMTAAANIQGSDINNPQAWNPLNSILAYIEPDQGVALAKQLVYTIALKQESVEVFYDAQNTSGSPLGRVEGAKQNWGCLSADSVQDMGGQLFWLGSQRNGSPEVLMMDNLKATVVSTKPVERLLEQATLTDIISWTVKLDGHRFYILTLKNENLTLAYDLDENRWGQWTDVNGNYLPIVAASNNTSLGHIVQHESNGRLYLFSMQYPTDAGDVITVDLVTPNFDGGTRRIKQQNMLEIISDQRVGAQMMVRVNDEDYNPSAWSNWRSLDLSQPRAADTEWGSYYRRVHHFRYKSPVRMPRIRAVELQIDIGTL